jgi:hypothetical protein
MNNNNTSCTLLTSNQSWLPQLVDCLLWRLFAVNAILNISVCAQAFFKSSIKKLYFMDNCQFNVIIGNDIVTCNKVSIIHAIHYTNTLIPCFGIHHLFHNTFHIAFCLERYHGHHVFIHITLFFVIDAGPSSTSSTSSSVQQLKGDRRFCKSHGIVIMICFGTTIGRNKYPSTVLITSLPFVLNH